MIKDIKDIKFSSYTVFNDVNSFLNVIETVLKEEKYEDTDPESFYDEHFADERVYVKYIDKHTIKFYKDALRAVFEYLFASNKYKSFYIILGE